MQAELRPDIIEAMRLTGETLPERLKEMAETKVPFSQNLMEAALGHKAVDNIKVSNVQPGDIVTIEGKKFKVRRITDKGEWVTEPLPEPPTE